MKGTFITFEGGEGSGKTTQVQLLSESLRAAGWEVVTTREPGGTPGAEEIRKLLVQGSADRWDALTETLLFYAARLDHVHKLILPALKLGKIVLCDRYLDSTRVYQGIARGVVPSVLDSLAAILPPEAAPQLTLVLDIEPQAGLARAQARQDENTRFESMQLDFHTRVRQGFLDIAKQQAGRCKVIDAARTPSEVHASIIDTLSQRLGFKLTHAGAS